MFAAAKRAAYQTAELKAGRWGRMENIFLQNKTLGIIGTGSVGGRAGQAGPFNRHDRAGVDLQSDP